MSPRRASPLTPRRLLRRLIPGLVLGLGLGAFSAGLQAGGGFNDAELQAFIDEMSAEHQFDPAELRALFQQAELSKDILALMSRPAEGMPWHRYRPIFLTEERIEAGRAFWAEHAETLERAAERYGVPPEVIVAVIGVETYYGRITGGHRVIDALATLAFDYPRRAKFFRGELEAFLILARQQGVDPLSLSGSYAGAMGLPQFMPSSYRAYAVDFDQDNQADIWNNPADAIGSVANYLARHGWERSAPLVSAARVQDQRHRALLDKGLKTSTRAAELEGFGVSPAAPLEPATEVGLIELEAAPDRAEHWLGLKNFYVITRYNRSPLYAMAVHQLAEAIRAARPAAEQG